MMAMQPSSKMNADLSMLDGEGEEEDEEDADQERSDEDDQEIRAHQGIITAS